MKASENLCDKEQSFSVVEEMMQENVLLYSVEGQAEYLIICGLLWP